MKRNSKRRHYFNLIRLYMLPNGKIADVLIGMLQTPKVPEKYAWKWALKLSREYLIKENIPVSLWSEYQLYPLHSFNCTQLLKENKFYDHIHVAEDSIEEDDKMLNDEEFGYNKDKKSRYNPHIPEMPR